MWILQFSSRQSRQRVYPVLRTQGIGANSPSTIRRTSPSETPARLPDQELTATLAFAALQNSTIAEFEQDQLQELPRDSLGLSNIPECQPLADLPAGMMTPLTAYLALLDSI